jgi:hypothetical protein
MKIKHTVVLTQEQRKALSQFCRKGVHSVRLANRARIILALDASGNRKPGPLEAIAGQLGTSRQTLVNTRGDFLAAEDVRAFLRRKPRETPPVPPKVTGEVEARIIALACSQPPPGCARWTLELLAQKTVALKYLDSVSGMTVCRLLKKRGLSLT